MDLTVSFPCITSESSTYAHARLHEEYSIVQIFFRERPSFCMHGWLKLVIMPVGPTPVQHISWSPIKKRRENSLFDTREMTRSFLGSQKNFVPYLTLSSTFVPSVILRRVFRPATVKCHVKIRFCPCGPHHPSPSSLPFLPHGGKGWQCRSLVEDAGSGGAAR